MKKRSAYLKFFLFCLILGSAALLYFSAVRADQDLISLFPIENYNQNLTDWFRPNEADYDKPLLSAEMQQHHMDVFYNHLFGSYSPWEAGYVNQVLSKTPPEDLNSVEQSIIQNFNNENKPEIALAYGENFRPHSQEWIKGLAGNIDLNQLTHLVYQEGNRAIAVDNLQARALPTEEVSFYSYKIAGEGYPFDNLQMSTVWAGTPLYILAESRDQAWSLVLTPEFIGWVKSNGLARADAAFVNLWKEAAKKTLVAITRTQTSIHDDAGRYHLTGYVGAVFPAQADNADLKLFLPAADADHRAVVKFGKVSAEDAVVMPLQATPRHFSQIMGTLIGRPYGWGGLYFYSDCSSELKNLLTPFGIRLPRHSSDQVYAGKLVDLSSSPAEQRLAYLMQNGHRFLTLIYIGGHVMMYVGNFPNPNDKDHAAMAMTYQDMWGLSPYPSTRRAVVGKSVLFPMLLRYPEDNSLASLASKKYFQVAYLDEMPNFEIKLETIDVKALMSVS